MRQSLRELYEQHGGDGALLCSKCNAWRVPQRISLALGTFAEGPHADATISAFVASMHRILSRPEVEAINLHYQVFVHCPVCGESYVQPIELDGVDA